MSASAKRQHKRHKEAIQTNAQRSQSIDRHMPAAFAMTCKKQIAIIHSCFALQNAGFPVKFKVFCVIINQAF